ncbi:MAG: DUF2167 domain-containing protein [Phycisphaerales bacterium]|nr:DUF2167 domain-containing protein [Phycisphaerales bacterium]
MQSFASTNHVGGHPAIRATLAAWLLISATVALAQEESKEDFLKAFPWKRGPAVGKIGAHAEVQVPKGYAFLRASDTQNLLESFGNPTSGRELGLVGPDDLSWFVVYEYDDCGYVKDDERDKLDADAMLKSIRAGNEAGNEERKKRGFPPLKIVGWEQPPRYDTATNNLVWAVRFESEGDEVVNYNTRRLGREGVMEVTLVVDPTKLSASIPAFENIMKGYQFVPGKQYAEFKPGDRIAEYGLAALVTGGAAAVAAKAGLFKVIGKFLAAAGKFIIIGLVAIGAVIKGLFSRKSSAG